MLHAELLKPVQKVAQAFASDIAEHQVAGRPGGGLRDADDAGRRNAVLECGEHLVYQVGGGDDSQMLHVASVAAIEPRVSRSGVCR